MEKQEFIDKIKGRTKKLAIDSIKVCESLTKSKVSDVITYQLIKSATSVGANYRATSLSRSKAEFYSKISITIEELDETIYWLEIILDVNLSPNDKMIHQMIEESTELLKILNKARSTTSGKPTQ